MDPYQMGIYFSLFKRQFYLNFWPPYLTRMVTPNTHITSHDEKTSSYPALKRVGSETELRLADDSGPAYPILINSEEDFIKYFGAPSSALHQALRCAIFRRLQTSVKRSNGD